MKIRMDSEDSDEAWFDSLRFSVELRDFDDWAYLLSCVMKNTDCSKLTIIRELINRECGPDEMRVLHEWIGKAIQAIDNLEASDDEAESK